MKELAEDEGDGHVDSRLQYTIINSAHWLGAQRGEKKCVPKPMKQNGGSRKGEALQRWFHEWSLEG